jgi:hypothetical protein
MQGHQWEFVTAIINFISSLMSLVSALYRQNRPQKDRPMVAGELLLALGVPVKSH